MKWKIVSLLVLLQLIIIGFLVFRLLQNNNKKIGQIYVDKMNKQSFVFTPSSDLQNFYEPKSSTLEPDYDLSYKVFYHLNGDTFNEFRDYRVTKPDKIFRIIVLGDSWTYGIHVNTEDNWTEKLEKALNDKLKCANFKNYEVINLGVPGYDIQYSLERFKKRGEKYNADAVLWLISDAERIDEKILPIMNHYVKALQDNYALEGIAEDVKNKETVDFFRMAWIMVKTQLEKEMGYENIIKYQQKYLGELYSYFSGNIVFMTAPTMPEKEANELLQPFKTKEKTSVHKLINILSMSDTIIKNDGHPNPKGHELIAQDIFDYITKNKIIPCEKAN